MYVHIYTHTYVYTRQNYICWKRWSSVTIIVNWKTSFQRLARRISPAGFSLLSNFAKKPCNCIYSVINAFGREAMTASPMEWCNPHVKSCFCGESPPLGSCQEAVRSTRRSAQLSQTLESQLWVSHTIKKKKKNPLAGPIKHFMWNVAAYKLRGKKKKALKQEKRWGVPKPSNNFSVYHDFDEASDPTVI